MKEIKEMKTIKKQVTLILAVILGFLSTGSLGLAEIIEKIYASVNGEPVTYSKLKIAENEMIQILSQQFKDEELKNKIQEMKKGLLDRLIEQAVLTSFAKEKNYNVDGDLELMIKDTKKQYNFNSDEELKSAMAAQGIKFEDWKEEVKITLMQRNYIGEMIRSKIKIDSSAIMEYYKANIKTFTLPSKVTLNCIFINKSNYIAPKAIQEKKDAIDAELLKSNFADTAKKYTDLPGGEILLGEFKQGELEPLLEKAAMELKKDAHSGWIETNTGWYIIQLVNRADSQLVDYGTVRNEIENILIEKEQGKLIQGFLDDLKKDSHIKIYEKW
jgi:peptidyl-prolyl cis-trans isomerase SurA